MKILLVRFVLLSLFPLSCPNSIRADCMDSGIWFYPNSGNVPINSEFVITGYGRDQEFVKSLTNGSLKLTSTSDSIYLKPIKTYLGSFGLTQTILKPERAIKSGVKYSLNIKDYHWIWTVTSDTDLEAPEWKSEPAMIEKVYHQFGCGPEIGVNIGGELHDKNPTSVLVTLKDSQSNKELSTYLVPYEEKKFFIGHDMCSGAFSLELGREYRASLVARDIAGNVTESKEITFHSPEGY